MVHGATLLRAAALRDDAPGSGFPTAAGVLARRLVDDGRTGLGAGAGLGLRRRDRRGGFLHHDHGRGRRGILFPAPAGVVDDAEPRPRARLPNSPREKHPGVLLGLAATAGDEGEKRENDGGAGHSEPPVWGQRTVWRPVTKTVAT